MDQMTWTAITAVVLGGLVRALKEDALGAILTRFFRPDGPPIAIPTRALPWLALALGGAAAVFDARTNGADWGAAAKFGVNAAALAVLGHELLSGVPGAKKIVGVLLLVGGLSTLTACSWLQSKGPSLLQLLADKGSCVLPRLDLPADRILKECFADAAQEDVPKILELISAQKADRDAVAARAAAQARDREQWRISTLHCAPGDADAGAK